VRDASSPLHKEEGKKEKRESISPQISREEKLPSQERRPSSGDQKGEGELKKSLAKKDDQKGPTPEKLDALAAALAKLQQKTAQIAPLVAPQPEIEKKEEPKEVPLDVLKDVLKDEEI
jgi:hypothetical protein